MGGTWTRAGDDPDAGRAELAQNEASARSPAHNGWASRSANAEGGDPVRHRRAVDVSGVGRPEGHAAGTAGLPSEAQAWARGGAGEQASFPGHRVRARPTGQCAHARLLARRGFPNADLAGRRPDRAPHRTSFPLASSPALCVGRGTEHLCAKPGTEGAHRAALLRDQARPVRQPHGARAPRASLLPARDPRLRPSPPPARPSSPLRPRPRPGLPRRAPPWRGPRSPPHGPLGSAVRSLPAASSELLGGESIRLLAWVAHSRAGEPRPTGCGGGTRAPGGAGQVRPRPVPERPGPREPRAHRSAHPRASVCIS